MSLIIPNHVGIIMDGNGRWATKRNLNRSQGHLAGSETLIDIAEYCFNKGVKVLSVFAFSTENFKRSKDEVDFLMDLSIKLLKGKLKKIINNNIKVIFSGRKDRLPEQLLKTMTKVEKETVNNDKAILNICFNYGGRSEIVDVIKNIVNKQVDINSITEDSIKKYLYNDLPDLDLVIRTSGEYRISNFMLYQMAYAELYFIDTYWPDFKKEDFDQVIIEYNQRDRRFGNVK
ncbi:MAG: polyprenyl diphosphate synthase [Bacilli bacterium]|jgi:undecaprenyl diphosphate synthase|nr:polyprenyl diphosphate synthase [Bacilli bacterium]